MSYIASLNHMDGSTLDDLGRELTQAISQAELRRDLSLEDGAPENNSDAQAEVNYLHSVADSLSHVISWRNGLCDAARDARREPARRMAADREQFAEGGL